MYPNLDELLCRVQMAVSPSFYKDCVNLGVAKAGARNGSANVVL